MYKFFVLIIRNSVFRVLKHPNSDMHNANVEDLVTTK